METPLAFDSHSGFRKLESRPKVQKEEHDTDSVIKIVANDIYNTPRDKSPSPIPAPAPAPQPRQSTSKANQPALSALAASRQRRTVTGHESLGKKRQPTISIKLTSGAEPGRKGRPVTSSFTLPADGRASLKGSPVKQSPPRRPTSSSSSSISRDRRPSKPGWTDLAVTAPAKTVTRSRMESITATSRRSTKDSERDTRRDSETPTSRLGQTEKPFVPSLNLQSLMSGSLDNLPITGASSASPGPSYLSNSKGEGLKSNGSMSPSPLTARSGNSTTRLGSSRIGRVPSFQAPAQHRFSIPGAEVLQREAIRHDSSSISSRDMPQLDQAACPSSRISTFHTELPPLEIGSAATRSVEGNHAEVRHAERQISGRSLASSKTIEDAMPVAPLSSSRLKRVDSPSEAFSASQVGTGSTLASFLALKASPASPRPGSEAQAARLSQRDSSTHPCTAPAKDSTQPSTSGAKDSAQPSATRTKDMAALLSSSSKPVQKGSSAAPSPRLGRSVASVPHTPRADPVTYESSRLGSARGLIGASPRPVAASPRLPKPLTIDVNNAAREAELPSAERTGRQQAPPMTPIAELPAEKAQPSPRLGSHRSSTERSPASAAVSPNTESASPGSARRAASSRRESHRSSKDLATTELASDSLQKSARKDPNELVSDSPIRSLLSKSAEASAESPRQRLLPHPLKRVLNSPRKSPLPSANDGKDSWNSRALAHTVSDMAHLGKQPEGNEPLSRVASLPTSLRSAGTVQSRKDFMKRPGPSTAPIQCTILRDAVTSKGQTIYTLYLDDPAKLILAAQKRKRSKTCSYTISLDYQVVSQENAGDCGRVKSNFLGTHFSICDDSCNTVPSTPKEGSEGSEVGLVKYQTNILGTRGPRKMTVMIPKLDSKGSGAVMAGHEGGMTQRMKDARASQHCLALINKPPKWNDQLGAFCLNFGGRVTHASVKNFQLVAEEDHECIILQFGKIGKDKFSMDFRWPMSTIQAFGICLSSFDSKLACE